MDSREIVGQELRLVDLVAKNARVSLKDALRVLRTANFLSKALRMPVQDFVASAEHTSTYPSERNVAACEFAQQEVLSMVEQSDRLAELKEQTCPELR